MTYEIVKAISDFIKSRITDLPSVGIVCGSGLANLVDDIDVPHIIDYSDIPNFPTSTVQGHKSKLIFGKLGGKNVVAMQGRFHFYEGYNMQQVTLPMRVMKFLGVEDLILTNASGGMNPLFKVGDIMFITDHINMLPNPLIGKNDDRFGVRFPSMNEAYSLRLLSLARDVVRENGIDVKEGVYLGNTGPCYETPAEYNFYHRIGADCVGMSTVPEVIVAVHLGIRVFAMSLISNIFDQNANSKCTHQEVLEVANKAEKTMMFITKELIGKI